MRPFGWVLVVVAAGAVSRGADEDAAQLRRLDVKQGLISIGGVSLEPLLTDNAKKALAPVGN